MMNIRKRSIHSSSHCLSHLYALLTNVRVAEKRNTLSYNYCYEKADGNILLHFKRTVVTQKTCPLLLQSAEHRIKPMHLLNVVQMAAVRVL